MIRDLRRRAAFALRGLRLVWAAAPGWALAWGLLLLLQGLVPVALVYCSRLAVDGLEAAADVAGLRADLALVGPPVLAMAGLWLLFHGLTSLVVWVRTVQAERVQDHLQGLIHGQALAMDVAFFESPAAHDLLHRVRGEARHQPLALLESTGALVQHGITLAALAVLLAGYAPWLPVLLLGCALPGVWALGRMALAEHRWRVAHTLDQRREDYLDWLLTDRSAAQEVRLFDLGGQHRAAFAQVRAVLREGRLALARSGVRAGLLSGLAVWAGGAAGMAWMILRDLKGQARLGDVVLCYQAFLQGERLLHQLLESTGRTYRATLFMEHLFEFLDLRPAMGALPGARAASFPLRQGIRLEDVTFHYPGTDRLALDRFTLDLPAGQLTAIVGPNGAGKSTLIKLLCRFYDPERGRILLDGVDVRDLDRERLRRDITVLFQEPMRFHATAGENLRLGDLAVPPDSPRILAAARASGADGPISRLPQGYRTLLGKGFGGEELSVGEWQRLALGRAFLRDAGIILLDEPTSAMDAWAESDWLGRLRRHAEGRLAVLITHRFTTAMHADRICVLAEGRVVECGDHAALLASGGLYAASWRAQMVQADRSGSK